MHTYLAFLVFALISLAVTGASVTTAAEFPLRTDDGLALSLDDAGMVTSLRVDGRELLRQGAHGGLFLADVAGRRGPSPQLLPNPGFEALSEGRPDGWDLGPEWSVDQEAPHSGKTCMKVDVRDAESGSSGALATRVEVKPNTPYRVALWMRTRGCAPAMYIQQFDARGEGRESHPQIVVSHARRDSDWFELSEEFVTAPFCRQLRVRANLWHEAGQAWVDDVTVTCVDDDYVAAQQAVRGQASAVEKGATVRGEAEGVEVTTTYSAQADHLRVHCEMRDTTGRDRAVSAAFRLPIQALGWTWYDDLHSSATVEPGFVYGAGRGLGERRVIGLYPFAGLGDEETALGLAVPMDQPRIVRLCYDDRHGYYATYEFGLAEETSKFPRAAWFDVLLYRVEPAWGFRSAAQRYYETFPGFFEKRVSNEGPGGFMVEEEVFDSPEFNVPEFAILDGRRPLADYRREGTRVFSYTEFAGWWGWALGTMPEKARVQPSYDDAWARVERIARGEEGTEDTRKVAQCILNCTPFDADGKRRLHGSYVAEWGGHNYLCNPDPEIEGEWGQVNRYTLTQEREVSRVASVGVDGMYYDCAFVFNVDNFRREHFRWADSPLAFDHATGTPCLPLVFSIYECAKAIADQMHESGKLVMSNYSVCNLPTDMFSIQFIDVIGNEMLGTWTEDPKFSLQRTLARQKTVAMTWQEHKKGWPTERVEAQMKQAMFYGTFYWISTMDRQVYERWTPLTRRLAAAGWEPITHARASDPAVMVERFGHARDGDLHFTLRNDTSQGRDAVLRIEARELGLAEGPARDVFAMLGARRWEKIGARATGEVWEVPLVVPAKDTVVLRVADEACLARDQLHDVPLLLARAESQRAALAEAGIEVKTPDLVAARDQVQRISRELAEGTADRSPVAGELGALAAELEGVQVPKAEGRLAAVARRLGEQTTAAREQIALAAKTLGHQP